MVHAHPSDESPELWDNLWLGVQCAFQLINLVWRQPKDSVLSKHGARTFHHGPQDKRRQILLLHDGSRPNRLKRLRAQPQVDTC